MAIRISVNNAFNSELAFRLRNVEFACDKCSAHDLSVKEVGTLRLCQPCRREHYNEQQRLIEEAH